MTDIEGRDVRGRYLPGTSGNPRGRPPGRTPGELDVLADEGVAAVLTHDLGVARDDSADPRLRKEALNRLARLGARRITSEPQQSLGDILDEILEIIKRHVTDPSVKRAIGRDLCALLDPDPGENDDAAAP